jgi:RNA polymerase sigma-70 factor (ECF subfamily)
LFTSTCANAFLKTKKIEQLAQIVHYYLLARKNKLASLSKNHYTTKERCLMTSIANETNVIQTEQNWKNWKDEELLTEYRYTGVREAFDELVHRYERELYNYLYRYLGNAANAEDAFQKTFLTIMEECDKFDASKKFRPWLYKIATNKAIDCLREKKRFSVVSIDVPQGADENSCTIAEIIQGKELQPFEEPMAREIAGKVREAVAALPDQMRQVVYMVYFQGLSYREAAEVIGVHNSTMAGRMKHAITKLNFSLRNVG